MIELLFIGDTHGTIRDFTYFNTESYQFHVGDVGFGFGVDETMPMGNVKFIRGNHDNPEIARKHPNYLGDYGFIPELSLFYMSGAGSVSWDKACRTPGYDWWPEEELNYNEAVEALKLYIAVKPKIVLTHDAPVKVSQQMQLVREPEPNTTNMILQSMFDNHQPEEWVFGHHHRNRSLTIQGTHFYCVGMNDELYI